MIDTGTITGALLVIFSVVEGTATKAGWAPSAWARRL